MLKKYLEKAGVGRATIQTLRHTFGVHHIAKGTNIKTIQEVMGLKSYSFKNRLSSTSKRSYFERIAEICSITQDCVQHVWRTRRYIYAFRDSIRLPGRTRYTHRNGPCQPTDHQEWLFRAVEACNP